MTNGDSSLIITTSLDPCLLVYPLSEWNAFEERLSRLPQFDDTVTAVRRIYVSGAIECEIDKLGRVLIPVTLRKHADLKRELVWAGMGRNVEIWSKSRFEQLRSDLLDDAERRQEIARRLTELGL